MDRRLLPHLFLAFFIFVTHHFVVGQSCGTNVPSFVADLTGNPGGTWLSPNVTRLGNCCGTSNPDRCVRFTITLDPGASGIVFDIASGAIPGGSLFYQINCGPQQMAGQVICLNGVGPHELTFCKPGNNDNVYSIRSIPKPNVSPNVLTNDGCSKRLWASGLVENTITWTSVGPGTVGQYNSFLNCTTGCDTVTVTPGTGFPSYIDYRVCGTVAGGCGNTTFCDTVRITINPTLQAVITPVNPVVCFGSPGTTITANLMGGTPPYTYLWNTGATTQSILATPGNYDVWIDDATDCPPAFTTVTVNGFSMPIDANAGGDINVCNQSPTVTLSGSVSVATGGTWSGGTGTFSPNANTLNASYTLSASEVSAGFAQLVLTTTGNFTCPADRDTVIIRALPFNGTPNGVVTNVSCFGGSNGAIDLSIVGGTSSYTYLWSNGATTQDISGLIPGNYSVTITDALGCTRTANFTITQPPAPVSVTGSATNVSCFAVPNATIDINVTGGVSPYTYLWSNGATTQDLTNIPAGIYSVQVTDANGCVNTSYSATITQPPAPLLVTGTFADISCFGLTNGSADITPTGGTLPYTYLWSNGATTQDLINLSTGTYSVTVSDANGCTNGTFSATISQPAAPLTVTGSTTSVSCFGGSNASIDITPTGGTAPYTYLWSNGATTQDLSGVSAGNYSVTVTDANGCTNNTFSATITQPAAALAVTGTNTNVSCFGGSNAGIDITQPVALHLTPIYGRTERLPKI